MRVEALDDDDDDDTNDDDELFLPNGLWTNGDKPYFQPEPLLEVLTNK